MRAYVYDQILRCPRLQKALVIPKVWLRWQLNYLKGAPVILAISVYYAWATGFSVFWDV